MHPLPIAEAEVVGEEFDSARGVECGRLVRDEELVGSLGEEPEGD
jgi:hypothetical protein